MAAATLVAEAPKDHALFVGASLQVKDGATFRPIVSADRDTVGVLADGQLRTLPRQAVTELRIEMGLKLCSLVARVDNLQTRTLVPAVAGDRWAADRLHILMDSMIDQNEDTMDNTARRMADTDGQLAVATAYNKADLERNVAEANSLYREAAGTNANLANSVSTVRANGKGITAVEVVCEVSAPRETRDAYAVMITEYRMNQREKARSLVHLEPLAGLGPKPRQLKMQQTGLPEGFMLSRVGVHLYADGQELATNVSEQRVDLTEDDALRYLVLCYVAEHSKATVAATPLRIAVPPDLGSQLPAGQTESPLFVTVGPDGVVQSVSTALGQTVAASPAIDSVVRRFRYNPALEAGKPVTSVVTVKLADYLR